VIDPSSYSIAMAAYAGCALLLIVLLWRWWGRRGSRWRLLWLLLIAALSLTPAPVDQGTTLAPAFIVLVFEVLTTGWEGAAEPAAWLTLALLAAVVLGVAFRLILGRRRPPTDNDAQGELQQP